MISRSNLKECFDIDFKNDAFFTGGKVKWSQDGSALFCPTNGNIHVVDVELGRSKISLGGSSDAESDVIYCFAKSWDDDYIVTAHKSGLFKYWQVSDGTLLKNWKSIHKGPVAELEINKGGNLLASGGSDSITRIWDLVHHSCTLALRGAQGVVSILKFHQTDKENHLFATADDLKINCWNLENGSLLYQLSGHYSRITSLSIHHSGYLASCGRDKVVMLWDLDAKTCLKTLPVFESLEGVVCLPNKFELPGLGEISGGVHVATVGEKGVIRIFDIQAGREIFTQQNSLISAAKEDGGISVTQLLYNADKNCFAVITAEHNVILYALDNFTCVKQLVGYTDEILDVVYVGPDNSHIAVATNSCDIKLYNVAHMGCQLLKGHLDLVISLAVSFANSCLMISGAKDNTVRLWEFNSSTQEMKCLAVGSRHTGSVSAVCFSQLCADFILSASNDTTLKLWSVKTIKGEGNDESKLIVKFTEVAHQKDINCVCVSPNDKLAATASQDKTVKLWSVEDLSLIGTLRGHRRGVWCVRFSPVDRVLLSSSADCTIKIWSISDLNCLKTFEGHESSVLKAEFISKGMQIVSTSGDGLLKLWEVKTSECVGTFDQHTGRVWALAVSSNEDKLVTGGSDSMLITWRDSTEDKRNVALKEREEMLLQEQQLANLINNNQLFAALALALSLDRPFKVLTIIKDLMKSSHKDGLRTTLKQLTDSDKEKLLKCSSVWNSNSKNCDAAQLVISILLDEVACGELKLTSLPSYVEELLPYTERHFKRLTGLLEDLHFLEYTMASMRPESK